MCSVYEYLVLSHAYTEDIITNGEHKNMFWIRLFKDIFCMEFVAGFTISNSQIDIETVL